MASDQTREVSSREVVIPGSRGELMDILEDAEQIDRLPWRHGHRIVLVFEHEGRHLKTTIEVHPEEGWQLYGSLVCTLVRKVEKTITVWEDVPNG